MAFREFVSNAIDAAIAVNRQANGNAKWPWDGVKVELVPEEKVRAKRGYTRVLYRPTTRKSSGSSPTWANGSFISPSRKRSPRLFCQRNHEIWTRPARPPSFIVVVFASVRSTSIRPKACSITT